MGRHPGASARAPPSSRATSLLILQCRAQAHGAHHRTSTGASDARCPTHVMHMRHSMYLGNAVVLQNPRADGRPFADTRLSIAHRRSRDLLREPLSIGDRAARREVRRVWRDEHTVGATEPKCDAHVCATHTGHQISRWPAAPRPHFTAHWRPSTTGKSTARSVVRLTDDGAIPV